MSMNNERKNERMKDLTDLKKIVETLNGIDLQRVKEIVDEQLQFDYEKPENFMLHEKTDDYLYEVYMNDNSKITFCIGKKAYKEYQENKRAVSIYRKTKDLFPERELLIERV